jgi:NAD(P)H-dependent flavin oxidoreductase YrpB (nitropropane dioxygenase family)
MNCKKEKFMKLPNLKIGNLNAHIPIVLGGMGIGVTRSNLASAVANEGGIGVMSGIHMGYDQPDFKTNTFKANVRAIKEQIKLARELSPKGIIGINFMTVMNRYSDYVKTAVEEGIDLIVSGAGLPLELPGLVKNTKTKIVPIVSSGRALKIILRKWDLKYQKTADAVVIEGIKAGGHLGFKLDQLAEKTFSFKETIEDVKNVLAKYEEKYGMKIPVIAAGGIFDRNDVEEALRNGADAVQMSTRFIGTVECDAADEFKQVFVEMKKEDIEIIVSPVGLPARAYRNKFIDELKGGLQKVPDQCTKCIKTCDRGREPYCISEALINAVSGNIDEGLIFTGTNGYKIDKITTVKEIFDEFR